MPGHDASNRAARNCRWRATSETSSPRARSNCSRIGPIASPKASSPRPNPTGRAASSATSSSRQWDWGKATAYLHDAVSTDRRNPRLNANGKVYGSPENSTDFVPILDPRTNTASEVEHPVRDPKTATTKNDLFAPSAVWGDKPIWDSQTLMHNPMMDEKGRVWFTARIRPGANPDFCKAGSNHPSAKAFPLQTSGRQLSYYDPASGKFTLIDTCFSTHHLNFAHDANDTLWLSSGIGGDGAVGWVNTKLYDETRDEQRSQGWTPFILDTNGNGKRDAYVEPNQPADRREGQARPDRHVRDRGQPLGRHRLGNGNGLSGPSHPRGAGREPERDRAHRNLPAADAGLRPARRRRRCQRRLLVGAVERASRKLRPAQVQGPERAEPPPARIARKAGRSTPSRDRNFRA